MSEPLPVNEDQRDVMQELCNVAMGVAGEALAHFTGVFVELPIPKIRYVKPADVTEALAGLRGEDRVSGVIQAFTLGSSQYFALVAITETGLEDLAHQKQLVIDTDEKSQQLLIKLSTVITDSCLPALAQQLGDLPLTIEPPQLLDHLVPLESFGVPQISDMGRVLTAEINYHLEHHPFNCDLLLLMPDENLPKILDVINDLC